MLPFTKKTATNSLAKEIQNQLLFSSLFYIYFIYVFLTISMIGTLSGKTSSEKNDEILVKWQILFPDKLFSLTINFHRQ